MAQHGCIHNITPWHHIGHNYYLAIGFQIRNLKWPKFYLCCLAKASSYAGEGCRAPQGAKLSAGNWAWCHPKVPLVNGPWDAGEPWLLWARQSANTSLSLPLQGPAIRVPLWDIPWHRSVSWTRVGPPHTVLHCASVQQRPPLHQSFRKGFLNRPNQEFFFKTSFSGKKWISHIHVFTCHRNSDDCQEEKCLKSKMCCLQFDF